MSLKPYLRDPVSRHKKRSAGESRAEPMQWALMRRRSRDVPLVRRDNEQTAAWMTRGGRKRRDGSNAISGFCFWSLSEVFLLLHFFNLFFSPVSRIHSTTIGLVSRRPTCRSFRGSCSTVPGWPSRTRLSTWPSTSSCCWTLAPPPRSTPLNSCWMSTRMERGGRPIGGWNKISDG